MTSIGIIGSGFGAIAVVHELRQAGHDDIRLWERADDIGGVWRDNSYPGAGCDVPSPLYCFSWAPNSRWSRRYALRDEILTYLHRVADAEGVTDRVQLGREVVAAAWDEETSSWTVTFSDDTTQTVDVLVTAVGQLSRPQLPPVPGIDEFGGDWFHSAEWDHDVELRGRRVACVGVGASAIQYVPHVTEQASQVTLFQRSANYLLPKPDGPFARWYRPLVKAERPLWWSFGERFSLGLESGTRTAKVEQAVALKHLERQVSDPALRDALTPDYPIGCKRILFSNDFYPAVDQPHVSLVTDRVARVVEDGLVTQDGTHHPADVIVYGTGFETQDFLASIEISGRDGRKLATQWADGAHAHLGVHAPGFPNLLISYGPNTNLGGGSIIYMLEAQARHMRDVLDRMRTGGYDTVEVTAEAEERWDDEVQHELESSAWAHCDSWYRHPSGRITSNWPGATHPYAKRVRDLEPAEFSWS